MSRSTRITLLCHGATEASKNSRFPSDEQLLEGEFATAARIAESMAKAGTVFTAPELRARQSAALYCDAVIEPALRDIDHGLWTGRSLMEIHEAEPEALVAWLSSPEAAPHRGESIADAIGRIGAWLETRLSSGGRTLVVTHPPIARAAIVAVLDAPAKSFWKVDVAPWTMVELTSDGRRWALRSIRNAADGADDPGA